MSKYESAGVQLNESAEGSLLSEEVTPTQCMLPVLLLHATRADLPCYQCLSWHAGNLLHSYGIDGGSSEAGSSTAGWLFRC